MHTVNYQQYLQNNVSSKPAADVTTFATQHYSNKSLIGVVGDAAAASFAIETIYRY